MLKKNKVLTSLKILDCNLSPESLCDVCRAIQDNTTMTALDLSGNNFYDQSVSSLGKLSKRFTCNNMYKYQFHFHAHCNFSHYCNCDCYYTCTHVMDWGLYDSLLYALCICHCALAYAALSKGWPGYAHAYNYVLLYSLF